MSSSSHSPSLNYRVGDHPVPGYTLIRELGRGAMGVVWQARTDKGFELAIKIVGLEHSGGRKEWRGLALVCKKRIRHGNLLRLYDYWLKDKDGNIIPDAEVPSLAGTTTTPLPASSAASQLAATTPVSLEATSSERPGVPARAEEELDRSTDVVREVCEEVRKEERDVRSDARDAATVVKPGTRVDVAQGSLTTHSAATVSVEHLAQPMHSKAVQLIIAMDLGNGTLHDLREKQYQNRGTGLPADELLHYMRQAASGLDYLHEMGIVHRDIKPHNIMLVGDVPTICDYGLVTTADQNLAATSNAFSAPYASPEAVAWHAAAPPLTGKSDQYSLAISYYELRTGRLPFLHETLTSVYTAKETGNYDLSRIKNKAVRGVLRRALSKSAEARYANCVELVKELEKAERSQTFDWRMIAAAALVVVVACAAGYMALPFFSPPPQPSPSPQIAQNGPQPQPSGGDVSRADDPPPQPTPAPPVVVTPPIKPPPAKPTPPPLTDLQRAARQVLDATRGQADRLLPAAALARPFAEVVSAREAWARSLTDADRKPLQSLLDAVQPQLIAYTQPLDPAWIEHLPEVLPDAKGTLIERLRQRASSRDWPGFQVAETDFNQFVNRMGTAAGDPALAEAKKIKADLLAPLLESYLTSDQWLTDPAARQPLKDLLAADAGLEIPLAALLRVELEMAQLDETDKRYPAELRRRCERLVQPSDSKWRGYSLFLFALCKSNLDGGSRFSANYLSKDETELLTTWSPAASAWQTLDRSRRAAQVLVRVAENHLDSEGGADYLKLFATSKDQAAAAIKFLELAMRIGGEDAYSEGLSAVALAIAAIQEGSGVNWASIAKLTERAKQNWPPAKAAGPPDKLDKRRAVSLASALVTAHLPENRTSSAGQAALETFSSILSDHFVAAEPASEKDEVLYKYVVVPALLLEPRETPDGDKEKFAALWAAKGRLLERDPINKLIGDSAERQADRYTRSIVAATKAFGRARQLSDAPTYAAGYGRTTLKLPANYFESQRQTKEKELADIVNRCDAQSLASDVSLKLIAAWVKWERAKHAPSAPEYLSAAQEALALYQAVEQATANGDPFSVGTLARNEASLIHVQLAFSTDDTAAKRNHLRQAVSLAETASRDASSRLPEQPLIHKGNALEDLAYYCKETENYSHAAEAFREAAQAAELRSKVYARLALGRCYYRWATEPADSSSRDQRQTRLREAYENLRAAIDNAAREETPDAAEAHLWLAKVLSEAAENGPGDIDLAGAGNGPLHAMTFASLLGRAGADNELKLRAKHLTEAQQQCAKAAELSQSIPLNDRATYLRQWMEVDQKLMDLLGVNHTAKYFSHLERASLAAELAERAEEVLSMAHQSPRLVQTGHAFRALKYLVGTKDRISLPEGKKKDALEAIRSHKSLFGGAEYARQLVEVLLLEVSTLQGANAAGAAEQMALLKEAERLAGLLQDPKQKDRAQGLCWLARAAIARDDFQRLSPNQKKQALANPKQLEAYLQPYLTAETHLARSYGTDIAEAFGQLQSQKLLDIDNKKFENGLGNVVRAQRLREFIEESAPQRLETVQMLMSWNDGLGGVLQTPLSEAKRSVAKPLRHCLIVEAFARGVDFSPARRRMLEALETLLAK